MSRGMDELSPRQRELVAWRRVRLREAIGTAA